jgi:hypothetical protein
MACDSTAQHLLLALRATLELMARVHGSMQRAQFVRRLDCSVRRNRRTR